MKLLDKYDIVRIRRAYGRGETIKELSEEYRVSYNCIRNVVRGLSHPDDNYKVLSKIPTDDEYLKRHRKAGKTLEQLQKLEKERSGRPAVLSIETIRQRTLNEEN